ncbi:hypothetical protein QR680_005324 [Steinernema hermaphroditum]|uniref:Uncharacterized protein n=1 Tax=Steinernema hermaphroditum TaxID=289476 RepID=A0AA39LUM4_9BILA|nr:hypothetical protein QR680_005324 [Steinernema hermaphroditum]
MVDCCLCGLLWKAPLLGLLLRYIKGGQFSEPTRADGKVAVVTGASSGIGRRIAEQLNMRGAKVYLMCRNQKKAEEVVDDLVESGCRRERLIVRVMDLADLQSVRSAAHRLRNEEPKIDILVNNAGVFGIAKFEKTVDGFERVWQSNYLGHFLFTDLLIAQLRNSASARIVNVSSMMHQYADTVAEEVVNSAADFGVYQTYNRSKVAMVMHCRSLAKRFAEEGVQITANACHPGCVRTGIINGSIFDIFAIRQIIFPMCWFFMKSDLDGAQTPLYVALSHEVEGVTGQYHSDCAELKMGELAKNDAECEKLFEFSRRAVARSAEED